MWPGRWAERFDGRDLISPRSEFNSHTAYVNKDIKLNFDQFHPLDHWPWVSRCLEHYPNGWRSGFHHLSMAWAFHRRDQVLAPFHKYVLCLLGKHDVRVWYTNRPDGFKVMPMCEFCNYERTPTEDEISDVPPFIGGGRSGDNSANPG